MTIICPVCGAGVELRKLFRPVPPKTEAATETETEQLDVSEESGAVYVTVNKKKGVYCWVPKPHIRKDVFLECELDELADKDRIEAAVTLQKYIARQLDAAQIWIGSIQYANRNLDSVSGAGQRHEKLREFWHAANGEPEWWKHTPDRLKADAVFAMIEPVFRFFASRELWMAVKTERVDELLHERDVLRKKLNHLLRKKGRK